MATARNLVTLLLMELNDLDIPRQRVMVMAPHTEMIVMIQGGKK